MSKEIIKPDFLKCAVKVGTQYYKKSIFYTCVVAVFLAIAYGLIIVCKTLLPSVIASVTSLPAWIYLVVGCLLAPGVAAVVVCYIRQSKKEIEDIDKDYVCPE